MIDPDHDTTTEPLTIVNQMAPLDFFAYAAEALAANPPHATDFSILARLARIGLMPGRSFQPDRFSAEDAAAVEDGARAALADMIAAIPTIGTAANGWTPLSDITGVYGNEYFIRAVVTLAGLGANPREEAVYPVLVSDANGEPVVGERDYVLHFAPDELPPARAFWSLTMYDAEGFQIPNKLDRFALGDRDPLRFGPDGSLDLYISSSDPGPDLQSNWLPSGPGPLGATLRLYAPTAAVLEGHWHPPAVRRTR